MSCRSHTGLGQVTHCAILAQRADLSTASGSWSLSRLCSGIRVCFLGFWAPILLPSRPISMLYSFPRGHTTAWLELVERNNEITIRGTSLSDFKQLVREFGPKPISTALAAHFLPTTTAATRTATSSINNSNNKNNNKKNKSKSVRIWVGFQAAISTNSKMIVVGRSFGHTITCVSLCVYIDTHR